MGFHPAISRVTRRVPSAMVGKVAAAAAGPSPAADGAAQASPDAAAAVASRVRHSLRPILLESLRLAAIVEPLTCRDGRNPRARDSTAVHVMVARVGYLKRPAQASAHGNLQCCLREGMQVL